MFRIASLCLVAILGLTPALADTLTLNVEDVKSDRGQVMASLCGDPNGQFPGACRTYSASAPAQVGTVALRFQDITPGSYAISVFHDLNGNKKLDLPQETYAFGNDVAYPPSFANASVKVAGDSSAHVHLIGMFSSGAQTQAPDVGTNGVGAPAGVIKTDLRTGGLYGEFYVPAHRSPVPMILMLGGSEGGVDEISGMAVSFTAHGYAVLALAYWKEPGLPQTLEDVPLEYFDRAVAWLKTQPAVAPDRIGLAGWSRGAEAALLVAARNPDIHAVAAVSPSSIVWAGLNFANTANTKPAWTAAGAPLPWVRPSVVGYRPGDPMAQMFNLALPEADRRPETAIAAETINGPLLLLSGSDDRLWPSNLMSERLVARMEAAHFPHLVSHINYEGAGHAVFMGDPVAAPANLDALNGFMGGTSEGNAKARADSWVRVLAFFDAALKGTGQ